jgi:hypothetical protein
MRKERQTINTNIRLNLLNEQDRQAWEYLQNMDRKKYKSYSRAVVIAINDYFSRQEQLEADPFLTSRQKKDEFLAKVEQAIERGARESVPLVLAGNLLAMLQPYMKGITGEVGDGRTYLRPTEEIEYEDVKAEREEEENADAALDFADGF